MTEIEENFISDESEEILVNDSIDEWIKSVEFESTKDVPIPDKMVDQVIGQEDAAIVIKKAAKQRRHVIMIGDPGTGKSMLAKSMAELLPDDELEDLPKNNRLKSNKKKLIVPYLLQLS
jgi:Lon-like ATP-dependent protease